MRFYHLVLPEWSSFRGAEGDKVADTEPRSVEDPEERRAIPTALRGNLVANMVPDTFPYLTTTIFLTSLYSPALIR